MKNNKTKAEDAKKINYTMGALELKQYAAEQDGIWHWMYDGLLKENMELQDKVSTLHQLVFELQDKLNKK